MQNITKVVLAVILMCSIVLTATAQNKKMEFALSLGTGVGIVEEEPALGGHIGLNMYRKEGKQLRSEYQFSINLMNEYDGSDFAASINLLYGGRYYFTKPDQSVQIFSNLLVGGVYALIGGDDYYENIYSVGYSVGGFVKVEQTTFGLSIESYNSALLKVVFVL